jgi:hypothetical protein
MKTIKLILALLIISITVFSQGKNRTSYKSQVNTDYPSASLITAAQHRTHVQNELSDNIRFRLDVSVNQVEVGASGTATVDMTDRDRVNLDITGSTAPASVFDITITGMEDGDVKYILIDKTGTSKSITWTSATDLTPDPVLFASDNTILYEILQKGTTVYAVAKQVTGQATSSAAGVAEIATTAEAQTGTDDTKIMTPAKVQDIAASTAEAQAGAAADVWISPSTLQDVTATTTRKGIQENATAAETQAGSSSSLTVTPSTLSNNEGWSSLSLNAGFSGTVQYRKNNIGNVEITGSFSTTTTSGPIGTLPAGYRPSFIQYHTILNTNTGNSITLTIATNGEIDAVLFENGAAYAIQVTIFLTN